MRKYLLIISFSVIGIILLSIYYLTNYGIKTNKFNDLVNNKVKEFDPRISLELNDVYLKLNLNEKSLQINTADPKIFIDKDFIDLLDISINLNFINFIKKSNFINKIKITSKENSIRNVTKFLNTYKFNLPLFVAYNQIESGSIKAIANIYPSEKDNQKFKYLIIGKIIDANLNILNKEQVKNINFNFHVKDQKLEFKNINLFYNNIELSSKKISVAKRKDNFEIIGNFKNKKSLIKPKSFFKLVDFKLDILDEKEILIETDNNFSFNIDNQRKIRNINYKSSIKFDKIFINKKYQDLIFLKNGNIKTDYSNKNLKIKIDSEYSFLNDKYNKQEDKNNILINIKKNNNEDVIVDSLLKNKNTKINSKDLLKYFNFDDKIFGEQDIILALDSNIKFKINKKNKIKNLIVNSILSFDKIKLEYISKRLKKRIPDYNSNIFLTSDYFEVNYSKNKTHIKGKGKYSLKNKYDDFEIDIVKVKDNINFDAHINLDNSSIIFEEIDYKKNKGISSTVQLGGIFIKDKEIDFKNINYAENKNKILISNLNLSKDYKVINVDRIELNYSNENKKINQLKILKNNKNYELVGDNLDGSELIKNLLDGESNNSFLKIFNNLNSKIILNLNNLYVGNFSNLEKIKGNLIVKNNIIKSVKIDAFLNKNNKFLLNIKTTPTNEKITNMYIEKPSPFIKNYKFIKGFKEGSLSYDSIEKNGLSTSKLKIYDFKVKEVPLLAKLLTLASLQGIADLLTGEGIRFNELEMDYEKKTKTLTKIKEMYAIGPAISILMEGYIEKNKLTSLRGTLVPATTINKSIAKIPLLGNILVGKKVGEGVFGVSFKIKGPPENLKTTVNPIKTLTPRFITRTLEKIKKN
tara:strand:+ start:1036 stop:3627 length:2592 start_codon:yes stop_codon:yes gene_type:complete